MNESIFCVASLTAIAAWVALGLAPAAPAGKLRDRLLIAAGRVVPLGLCLLYASLLVANRGAAPGGDFSSLSAVLTLFSAPGKLLGGWVHFLAFDLLVGRWIVDDVLANGRFRAPLLVVLPATFMYGPLGVLLHVLGRSALQRARPVGLQ
jgi:hypothetical protein